MADNTEAVNDTILIVDFGSQVTQLIARRIREAHVYSEVVPFDRAEAAVAALSAKGALRGIILSGGPASVAEGESPSIAPAILGEGIPVLGICYGQQLLVQLLGGRVEPGDKEREFGRTEVEVVADSRLTEGVWDVGTTRTVWMSHGDRVTALPPGFRVVARSGGAPFAVVADDARRLYGVQFHPEVAHTPDGRRLLENFVFDVAGAAPKWKMTDFRQRKIAEIRAQVGDGQVICGLSGGVDSAVTAVLMHEAIGDQLTCVFVDHGLLRLHEAEQVVALFRDHFHIRLKAVDRSALFLDGLKGVTDPEAKRKFIGRTFISVFEEEARAIGGAKFLAQGTVYPDVIESVGAGGKKGTIKSHHNVGGLPERMGMELVEPLRQLFKDEVRALGRELGLPESFVGRHPFPGPGLAIRIPGEVTRDACDILRQADAIYLDEIRKAGLYDRIWQAFAVLLPVRTVGVMGDNRTYERVCALRAVMSVDGMTADIYPFDMPFLAQVATRIVNEVSGVNRVVYDCTSKPPGTIEWE